MQACWVNGRPVALEDPAISVHDRGFLLADGVFETIRAVGGVMIQLDAHLARLSDALARLEIPLPPHLDQTVSDAARALRASGEDAAVRLTVTRGVGAGFAPPQIPAEPTCVLLIQPALAIAPEVYTRGLSTIVATGRRNDRAATAGLKTLSYTDNVAALMEARRRGADDAILLDASGHVVEGTASNIFVVLDGEIYTPPLSCGILPGITRSGVMALVAGWNGVVQDRILVPSDLIAADEVFLTSSLRSVAPVASIDGAPVGGGVPGPLTRRVMAAYAQMVDAEVADAMSGV